MKIDSVDYGEIVVDGKTYYSDLVIWWDGKRALLEKVHLLDKNLLETIMKKKPDSIVVGLGLRGTVKIADEVKVKLEENKIPLLVDRTENAVLIYNGMMALGRKVAGILHVTL